MKITNMEHYRKEIEAVDYDFALINGDVCKCKASHCNKCDFGIGDNCSQKIIKWLMSEYKPDSTTMLTAREKHFVEFIENGFMARDKGGYLYWYEEKPVRENTWWISDCTQMRIVDNTLFSFITWDDEPIAVEDLRKLKVRNE